MLDDKHQRGRASLVLGMDKEDGADNNKSQRQEKAPKRVLQNAQQQERFGDPCHHHRGALNQVLNTFRAVMRGRCRAMNPGVQKALYSITNQQKRQQVV